MTGPRAVPGTPRPPEGRGAQPAEQRTSDPERLRPARTTPPSWFERHAGRIRQVTWLAVALIGIRLVAPRPEGWRRWSDASTALRDVDAVRTAALLYYQSAQQVWPAPGRPGEAPTGMLPFLPGDVSFGRERYRLAWEYAADTTTGARVVGISVFGDDPRLAQTMAQRAPDGMAFIVSGNRFTALIASAAGR